MTTNEREREAFDACDAVRYGEMDGWEVWQEACEWQRGAIAQPAPFDLEAMLRDCIPGGTVCDPQKIADGIREYFAERAQPAADAGQAVAYYWPMDKSAFCLWPGDAVPDGAIPLYAIASRLSAPAPQPLTDEEITAIYYAELRKRPKGDGKGFHICFARAIASRLSVPVAPHQDAGQAVAWIGPHQNAWEALNELRRSVAEIIGADPDTWPDHGNAPLAIAAAIGLREAGLKQRAAPVTPQPLTDADYMAIYEAAHKHTFFVFQREVRAIASRLGRAEPAALEIILGPDEDGIPIQRFSHRATGMAEHPNGTWVHYGEVERRIRLGRAGGEDARDAARWKAVLPLLFVGISYESNTTQLHAYNRGAVPGIFNSPEQFADAAIASEQTKGDA